MRAIFLDRDGVICENRADHVKNWLEFKFLPGAKESLAALSHLGLPIVVVTNQAAIGRGLLTNKTLEDIHQRMVAEIAVYGGRIDRIFYCPHRPEDKCDCRKPKPGLLIQAAEALDLDLKNSYLIGDTATDIQAGLEVGCHNILVLTGRGREQLVSALHSSSRHFLTVSRSLMEAADYILKIELSLADDAGPVDIAPYHHLPAAA